MGSSAFDTINRAVLMNIGDYCRRRWATNVKNPAMWYYYEKAIWQSERGDIPNQQRISPRRWNGSVQIAAPQYGSLLWLPDMTSLTSPYGPLIFLFFVKYDLFVYLQKKKLKFWIYLLFTIAFLLNFVIEFICLCIVAACICKFVFITWVTTQYFARLYKRPKC